MAVSFAASAVTITISCGAVGQEREFCEQATGAWAKATGNQVTVLSPRTGPTNAISNIWSISARATAAPMSIKST